MSDEVEYLKQEIADLERYSGLGRALYAVRLHERNTEDDPEVGTLMYSMRGPQGPWSDMVTGHPEWCWEIVDALTFMEDHKAKTTGGSA